MKRTAFSLVELSIVLVILGLLVGGILAGQSLIRASELRSVGAEATQFQTAIHAFRDKYFSMPGDMRNATSFWGDDAAACADPAVADGTPGTCNGNGDGRLSDAAGANLKGEFYQFWKQLALAGLIEGQYSGLAGAAGVGDATPIGSNSPKSKMGDAGWSASYIPPTWTGDASNYSVPYNNHLIFGAPLALQQTLGGAISPEEAWNIDTKIDDGMPARGRLIATYWSVCSLSSSKTDFDAAYRLNNNQRQCALRLRNIF